MRKDTEKALMEFKGSTVMQQKNIETLENMLWKDETVLFAKNTVIKITTVNTRQQEELPGFAILTNQRFLFAHKVLWQHSVESVSIRDIQAVSCSGNGLTGGHIQIQTMTKTYDVMINYKKEIIQKAQVVFDNARNSFFSSSSASDEVAKQPPVSAADEIKKYKELLDIGAITQAEFDKKKAQLLGI